MSSGGAVTIFINTWGYVSPKNLNFFVGDPYVGAKLVSKGHTNKKIGLVWGGHAPHVNPLLGLWLCPFM